MRSVAAYIKSQPFSLLLIALPLTAAAELLHWPAGAVFALSALGVIPLAAYIGDATEALAAHTSARLGALLNATLGNAAELIITIVAIRAGLLDLVKASITGSIIGNLLLVLGFAFVVGGIKNGTQRFDRAQAGRNAVLLFLAVVALLVPSYLSHSMGPESSPPVEIFSIGVAIVMIVLYGLGLLAASRADDSITDGVDNADLPTWSRRTAVIVLALATLAIVFLSEALVGSVEVLVAQYGLSEFFLGIILIPLIGNVAEHYVAVTLAHRNKMDLSVEVAVSSSLQIALFVAPALVFVSLIIGNPLTLIFNPFELLAILVAVIIAALVSADGESTWLEGAALLAVYAIFALGFFLLP
jgi:Ca2+:H+ antiporter